MAPSAMGGFARHHAVEGVRRLVARQRVAGRDLGDKALNRRSQRLLMNLAAARSIPLRGQFEKILSIWWPCSDAMLSGWNCTPCTGSVLCESPMIRPSSVSAVTLSALGKVPRSTTSE